MYRSLIENGIAIKYIYTLEQSVRVESTSERERWNRETYKPQSWFRIRGSRDEQSAVGYLDAFPTEEDKRRKWVEIK